MSRHYWDHQGWQNTKGEQWSRPHPREYYCSESFLPSRAEEESRDQQLIVSWKRCKISREWWCPTRFCAIFSLEYTRFCSSCSPSLSFLDTKKRHYHSSPSITWPPYTYIPHAQSKSCIRITASFVGGYLANHTHRRIDRGNQLLHTTVTAPAWI